MVKVAITGFGRIGRLILRAAIVQKAFEKGFDLVAINGSGDIKTDAYLHQHSVPFPLVVYPQGHKIICVFENKLFTK